MKKILRIPVLCLLVFLLCACENEKKDSDSRYSVLYVNTEETRVESVPYQPKKEEPTVDEFLEQLKVIPEENYKPLLPAKVEILSYELSDGILKLDMNQAYEEQSNVREVLTRSGLVKTFLQVPGVNQVEILVDHEPLRDSRNQKIGPMTAESFVENAGKEINAYQHGELTLYFTNKDGNKLVREKRTLYYSSNVPLERVVVEELIKGPKEKDHYVTLPENMKILGTTIADNICYLNFDQDFLDSALLVQEEIPIYSLVNSIVETCGAQKVQISVKGENKLIFRENMRLDKFYKAKTEWIEES